MLPQHLVYHDSLGDWTEVQHVSCFASLFEKPETVNVTSSEPLFRPQKPAFNFPKFVFNNFGRVSLLLTVVGWFALIPVAYFVGSATARNGVDRHGGRGANTHYILNKDTFDAVVLTTGDMQARESHFGKRMVWHWTLLCGAVSVVCLALIICLPKIE
jgi:hypothetical protein